MALQGIQARVARVTWQVWLLVGLLLFSLFIRVLYLPPIWAGGDAVRKWEFVRAIVSGAEIEGDTWNHHTVRWGVNLPALLTRLLCSHPAAYYIPSTVFAVFETALVFGVGRRLGSVAVGFWAAVCVAILPQMTRWSGQLTVEIFSPVYLLAAFYSLLRLESATERQQSFWVASATVAAGFAYLTKVPNVFFFPGLLYGLWLLSRSRRRHLLAACGSLALLFGVETLFYRLSEGHSLGRLSIISHTHLSSSKLVGKSRTFSELFDRYRDLSEVMGWLVGLFALACVVACLSTVCLRRRVSKPVRVLFACCLSFLFLHTFAVQDFHTFQPVQPPKERYFAVVAPFLALAVFWAVFALFDVKPQWGWLRRRRLAGYLFALLVVLLAKVDAKDLRFKRHALTAAFQHARDAKKAWDEGIPVVSVHRSHKSLRAYRAIFWPGLEHTGKLAVRPPSLVLKGRRVWYLIRSGAQGSKKKRRKLVRKWIGHPVIQTATRRLYLTVKTVQRFSLSKPKRKSKRTRGRRKKRESTK